MLWGQIDLYLVIDLSVDLLALLEALAHFLVGLQGFSVSSGRCLPVMSAS